MHSVLVSPGPRLVPRSAGEVATLQVTLSSACAVPPRDELAVSARSGSVLTEAQVVQAARRQDPPRLPELRQHDHREHNDLGETAGSRVWRVQDGREAHDLTRWHRGEQTVAFLIGRGRLESFEASDPAGLAETLAGRASRRLEATARAALANGDADGAYAAAYDAYRMAAEALLARQRRATGGDGSHMCVQDAVSAQFSADIPAFAKPAFEQLRRTRHTAQYFDPAAPPLTESDAAWAIEKADSAVSAVRALLRAESLNPFGSPGGS